VSLFRVIDAEKANVPVALACRVLGVSRSGFHAWQRRPPSDRELNDAWLTERIREIHRASRENYGAPRVHRKLREDGIGVGKKRVERLMRAAGLSGYITCRKGKTTIRVPGVRPAEDLVDRNFVATAPNLLWMSDIKEIPTWEGKLYLATTLDCFSRKAVGWSIRDDMRAELVVDALEMAVSRRRPEVGSLVFHSDQGSQYTALLFGQRCRCSGIAQSMGSKGDCFDNAVCESFHATLEKELLRRTTFRTKQEARTAIFDYIEVFYNRERLHSSLDYRSPEQYEREYEQSRDADCVDKASGKTINNKLDQTANTT
jgi:putative transposase